VEGWLVALHLSCSGLENPYFGPGVVSGYLNGYDLLPPLPPLDGFLRFPYYYYYYYYLSAAKYKGPKSQMIPQKASPSMGFYDRVSQGCLCTIVYALLRDAIGVRMSCCITDILHIVQCKPKSKKDPC
jgi:hypothetical protein